MLAIPSKLKIGCAIILLFFFYNPSFSQTQAELKGRVVDQELNTAIDYASVAVFSIPDSALVDGVVTDEEGGFSILLPKGEYRIIVRFIGYLETVIEHVEIGNSSLDIGDIKLASGSEDLEEVVVSGEKLLMRQKADRQIYSVEDFQASVGGTATDILRNLPSVSLNAEGELSVRGTSGFVILLNGKPVQADAMSILNQLPANAIEDIEIITSPSAKYDPEGKAGIINILTKKGSTDGVYLLTNVLLGAPSLDHYNNENTASRYGGDFTLNYRKNKWDISIGADFNRNDNAGFREGMVETYRGDTVTAFPSNGERSYRKMNYSGRAVIGYDLTGTSQINAAVYAGVRSENRTADILYNQTKRVSGELLPFESFSYFNENLRERKSEFFIGSIDYSKEFNNKSSLTISALYEKTVLSGPTNNLNSNPESPGDTINFQVMEEFNPLDGIRFNLDYTIPLNDKSTIQTGYQYRWLDHVGEFDFKEKILGTNQFAVLPEFSSNILLNRKINSFYGDYSYHDDNFFFNLGARVEHTDRTLEDYSKDETYIFNQLNLFPTANISYSTEGGFTWKGSYSRRIERTTTHMMNPFLARRHSEVLEVGDPNLVPELVDAVEVGAVMDTEKSSYFANLYYRKVNNVINQVNSVYNDSILYRTYTNAGVSSVKGLELGADLKPAEWWKVYLGGTVYHFDIQGNVIGEAIQRNSWIYSLNVNTTFELPENWDLIFNLNYLSRIVTIQGENSRFFTPNISLQKSLLDDRLNVVLHWKHIGMGWLNSNRQTIMGRGEGFYTSTNYIYERDMVVLTASFRINQLSKKLKFNKSEFGEREF